MKKIRINVLISHVSYQASAGSFIKMLKNSQQYICHIIGCDSIPIGFSSGSMLVDKYYHLPCETNDDNYINFIVQICKKENIDIIFSAEEEDLVLFKKNHIQEALYTFIPEESIFTLFRDKHLANEDVKSNSILIPETILNTGEFEISNNDKFIYRKRVSCCSRGIHVFNREEIPLNFTFFSKDYITQGFISGKEYTVDIFCDYEGVPHLIIPRQSLSVKDGTTFKCIIENEINVIDICRKIYSIYKIPGISNIQFIVKNGQPYFIELNPRAAATLIASSIVSVNFLDLYISHFLFRQNLPSYNELMKKVHWNSVISRYYQETVMYPKI